MTNRILEFNKAICMIEAVDDLRMSVIKYLVEKRNFDPNSKNQRGFSVVHYLCGIDNVQFAERTLMYLFEHGAKVNEPTLEERFTPLHIAAMNDRVSIAKILIKKGADKKFLDADNNPPMFYAMNNGCWTMIEVIRNYIFNEKAKVRKQNSRDLLQSAHLNNLNGSGANKLNVCEATENSLTPSRISYNFDSTSPYYVNITHRRKNNTSKVSVARQSLFQQEEKSVEHNLNIFELTEDNLAQFSKSIRESGRFEMFQQWQNRIKEHKNRQSMINDAEDLIGTSQQHIEALMTEDDTFLTAQNDSSSENTEIIDLAGPSPNQIEVPIRESDFIRSPKKDEVVIQMTERYIHTDDEENIVFYEKKMLPVTTPTDDNIDQESDKRTTISAASTAFKLNTDYDTDQLRQELTQFGDVPGPITKSTKKLYLKRLVKYRRDPKIAEQAALMRTNNAPVYSLELQKTFNIIHEGPEAFVEYITLEEEMIRHFQQTAVKKMRAGNKKMSFIYLLMDPRELNNLAANHLFTSKEQAWRQFIKAIFYVGKGKKSRPYAHLYEAIRHYSLSNGVDKENIQVFNNNAQLLNGQKGTSSKVRTGNQVHEVNGTTESKKLKRILDIWNDGQGVVSMHIFHNCTPSEACTREAAIIDAIGMNNLTNQDKGHYYGICESWAFKQRKQLGVALLYKALQIHLNEGESQLMPNDI